MRFTFCLYLLLQMSIGFEGDRSRTLFIYLRCPLKITKKYRSVRNTLVQRKKIVPKCFWYVRIPCIKIFYDFYVSLFLCFSFKLTTVQNNKIFLRQFQIETFLVLTWPAEWGFLPRRPTSYHDIECNATFDLNLQKSKAC